MTTERDLSEISTAYTASCSATSFAASAARAPRSDSRCRRRGSGYGRQHVAEPAAAAVTAPRKWCAARVVTTSLGSGSPFTPAVQRHRQCPQDISVWCQSRADLLVRSTRFLTVTSCSASVAGDHLARPQHPLAGGLEDALCIALSRPLPACLRRGNDLVYRRLGGLTTDCDRSVIECYGFGCLGPVRIPVGRTQAHQARSWVLCAPRAHSDMEEHRTRPGERGVADWPSRLTGWRPGRAGHGVRRCGHWLGPVRRGGRWCGLAGPGSG